MKEFLVTVRATTEIDVIVVATNTQFSNPTRDWVKEWQRSNPRPQVRLWDRESFERLAVKHPSVVARISPNALSPQGSLEAISSRFWNQLYLPNSSELERLWNERKTLEYTAEGIVALTAGEIANGDISVRSWLRQLNVEGLLETVAATIGNFVYLIHRSNLTGTDHNVIAKAAAQIIMTGFAYLPEGMLDDVIQSPLSLMTKKNGGAHAEKLNEMISSWLVDAVRSDLRDACSKDCTRVSRDRDGTESADLWTRLRGFAKNPAQGKAREFIMEAFGEPCNAGLSLSKEKRCPLFIDKPKTQLHQIQVYSSIVRNRLGAREGRTHNMQW